MIYFPASKTSTETYNVRLTFLIAYTPVKKISGIFQTFAAYFYPT